MTPLLAAAAISERHDSYLSHQGIAIAGGGDQRAGSVLAREQAQQAYGRAPALAYGTHEGALPLTPMYAPQGAGGPSAAARASRGGSQPRTTRVV